MIEYKKTWIIEYLGGCKGDFLTNYLNHGENFIANNDYSRSQLTPNHIHLKPPIDHTINNEGNYDIGYWCPEKDYLIDKLKSFKDFTFCNSHAMFYYKNFKNVFDEYNVTIKKITFDKKYYNTVFIEMFFKNYRIYNSILEKTLIKNNKDVNDKNKVKFAYDILSKPPIKFYDLYNTHSMQLKNKEILSYEDLYINFSTTDKDINLNLNWEKFKNDVQKTWLDNNAVMWGHRFNLNELGYRKF